MDEILQKLKKGLPFKGGNPFVVPINENVIKVRLSKDNNVWNENWDLKDVLIGFEVGEYIFKTPETNHPSSF